MDHTLHLPTTPAEEATEGSVTFIGNATVLLRHGGFTILTDPTFVHRHEEVSLGYGMTSKRLTDPAMDIADLPPIDFILLSHFHGDHFDQVAERDLDRDIPIVTTGEAADALDERGFGNTTALDTWQTLQVDKGEHRMRITACPARHGPGVTDWVLPEVMGSVLEFGPDAGSTQRIYVTGDTLVHDALREIPTRFPDLDLGLVHLGGTRVLGMLVTMDADQGVEAVTIIDPRSVLPIHYDDYDVMTSGLEEFLAAAEQAGIRQRITPWQRGDVVQLG